ncbi:MAG: alanine--glyoxylate aminotransferase family protein [Candidatus Melainabacteria bacterium]|nr:alanine--glyoxylate aminotransferase family protein [Candidatus Melainabacteria bacterium]
MADIANLLMIPGPTPLPDAVRAALAQPAIGHRSPDFKAVLQRVFPALQWAFQTQHPVLLYTASGTGAFEAALMNTLNPGDKVLSLICGVFSERWADMAESLGYVAERLVVPPGQPNTVEALQAALDADTQKQIKAVTIIHSETSTGVLNPVKALVAAVKAHGALSIVDGVTSVTSTEFLFDDWGMDVAISGSQKGFMVPPGLSFLALNERALAAHQQCKHPGYYFNFKRYLKSQAEWTTPYTPNTNIIQGLDVAFEMMRTEGLPAILHRHHQLQAMVRAGVRAMGLSLLMEEDAYASRAVTAVWMPEDFSVSALRNTLRQQFGITIADGQKELKGKIFRIGHLGYVSERDVYTTLVGLEQSLLQIGYPVKTPGAPIEAARQVSAQFQRQPGEVVLHA